MAYHVQQQVVATWTDMSTHTNGKDALYQMSPLFSASTLQVNAMRVVNDAGNVYATKLFGANVVNLIQVSATY